MAIHHRDGNPHNNAQLNLQVVKMATNLSDIVDAAQPDPDTYSVWLSVSADSPEETVGGFGQFATRPEAEKVAVKVRVAYDAHDDLLAVCKKFVALDTGRLLHGPLLHDVVKAAIAKAEPRA